VKFRATDATVEADGSISVLGRGSVCINSGGEKIFPEAVEAVLKLHPAVADAVVVGAPDLIAHLPRTARSTTSAGPRTQPPRPDPCRTA
jgi:acyl-CoA synthetase (AMP-forming)/AMP-acid ligase II